MQRVKLAKESETTVQAKTLPHRLSPKLSNGVHHYTSENGANIALMKDGDTYHVYDYSTGNISKPMTMQEANKALKSHYTSAAVETNSDSKIAAAMPLAEATANLSAETKNAADSTEVESAAEISNNETSLQKSLDYLGEYDETRKRHIESSGKDKISRNRDEIMEFIRSSNKNSPFERLHIGIINDSTASIVKDKTGININNYDFVLASNFVSHIFDSHGNEKTEALRGQKAVNDSNIENIIETVISPDDVSIVSDTSGTALKFEKNLNGRNVAITITSTKKSTLTLKSAWIVNKNSGGRTPSANANALAGTPEANSRNSTIKAANTSATTNSISDSSEKINSFEKNSSEKVSSYEKLKAQNAEIAKFAEENIKDYKKLNDVNRRAVRAVIRQGRAHGLSDADIITVAEESLTNKSFCDKF